MVICVICVWFRKSSYSLIQNHRKEINRLVAVGWILLNIKKVVKPYHVTLVMAFLYSIRFLFYLSNIFYPLESYLTCRTSLYHIGFSVEHSRYHTIPKYLIFGDMCVNFSICNFGLNGLVAFLIYRNCVDLRDWNAD